jgi:hypothetical protein
LDDGLIEMEYRGSGANVEFIDSGHSACRLDESEFASAVADDESFPLLRLQPSPCRSLGGYFSYEGWPDQQRFMELDEALRRKAYENLQGCKPKTLAKALGRGANRIADGMRLFGGCIGTSLRLTVKGQYRKLYSPFLRSCSAVRHSHSAHGTRPV